jgi:putative transposase
MCCRRSRSVMPPQILIDLGCRPPTSGVASCAFRRRRVSARNGGWSRSGPQPDVGCRSRNLAGILMMQVVMPRRQREGMAGHVFHVINRGARRQTLFASPDDYRRFQHLMQEATARTPMPIYVFCLMSTHFHFVVHPETDEQLPEFMRWLCCTHAKRFNRDHGTVGIGAVYQARYRAFPVQTDAHFLRVCRYVERNPLRAGLVTHAERWPWSSLGQRGHNFDHVAVRPWPIPRPSGWTAWVNQVVTVAEELAISRMSAKESTLWR